MFAKIQTPQKARNSAMKLFLIRYTKMAFIYLRLHKLFNPFSSLFLNLYYLTKMSAWAARNRRSMPNDFPSKWNYNKRYDMYRAVIDREQLSAGAIDYLEFGVAQGYSFRWFMQQNLHPDSRFHGFDTFTGLPEDFGQLKKGHFANTDALPQIDDARGQFYQGLFQQTLPGFIASFKNTNRKVIMLDADLFTATLYVLGSLAPLLRPGDIIFFDEFAVPTHEFRAFHEFTEAYYLQFECIAAANNYYFTAFAVK